MRQVSAPTQDVSPLGGGVRADAPPPSRTARRLPPRLINEDVWPAIKPVRLAPEVTVTTL